MENNSGGFSEYDKKIHKFGLISSIIIILTLACVPLAIQLVSGVTPDVGKVLGAMSGALVVFGPVAIIEFLSYTPILGAGGMYQTCIR